jgi:hypothetical protein
VLTVASPAQALADDPPRPTDIPAVSAYVEMVPTSRGPRQAGAGTARGRPLAPRIDRLLRTRGGDDAALLERLATSPAYGAPPSDRPKKPPTKSGPPEPATPSSSGNALSAAIDAGGDGGEGRLLRLLLVLTAVTAVIGAVAALRRRRLSAQS